MSTAVNGCQEYSCYACPFRVDVFDFFGNGVSFVCTRKSTNNQKATKGDKNE